MKMRKTFLLAALAGALAAGPGVVAAIGQEESDQQQAEQRQQQESTREGQQQQEEQQEAQDRQEARRAGAEEAEGTAGAEQRNQQSAEQRQDTGDRSAAGQGQRSQPIRLGVRLEDYGDRLAVAQVRDQSLAAQAGIQPEDVIVAIDGRQVRTPDQLRRALATLDTQRGRVPLVILRDNERQTVYLDLSGRGRQDRGYRGDTGLERRQDAWLGIALNARYEDFAVVQRVYPGTAAEEAGIQEGDWIVGINGQRVQSPVHLAQLVARMEPGQQVDIQVARRVTRTLQARLNEEPRRLAQELGNLRGDAPFEQSFDEQQPAQDRRQAGEEGIVQEEDQFFEEDADTPRAEQPDRQQQDQR